MRGQALRISAFRPVYAATRAAGSVLLCLLYILSCCRVHAQPSAASDEATHLYDEAEALMRAERYAEACDRYAQSQQLDPQLGTLLHLAQCQALQGKLASAYRNYLAAAALASERNRAGRAEPREQVALRRAEELKPRLSWLRLLPPAKALTGLQVSLDGESCDAAAIGMVQPVDPGTHQVRVEAAGYEAWSHSIALQPATQLDLALPPLEPQHAAAPPLAEAAPLQPLAVARTADAQAGTHGSHFQRAASYAVAGASLVGFGLAIYFGTRAQRDISALREQCPDNVCTLKNPEEYERFTRTNERARDHATAFNWAIALSGVAAAGAVVLFVTEPNSDSRSLSLSCGWSSCSVRGHLPSL